MLNRFTDFFVIWVVLACIAAWFFPAPFAALQPGIVPGLGLIMFGMGMSLRVSDFLRVAKMPRAVACGMAAQFCCMPLVAVLIAKTMGLSPELSLGMIIVGACPGGTASNVIAYLARADVALSVTMTACSTLLAVLLTPWIIFALGDAAITVDPGALFKSLLLIVLGPVSLGLLAHHLLKERTAYLEQIFPAISVTVIVLVIAAIVALSKDSLAAVVGTLAVAVAIHNLSGLLLGYGLAAFAGLPEKSRRTIAIEVGMQNSGLGVALANAHFASPLIAAPASLFSVVHNLSGTTLAALWRRRPVQEVEDGMKANQLKDPESSSFS